MYNYYNIKELKPEEILIYLRKSRADEPHLTIEEVLSNHEAEIDEWVSQNLSAPIPEENRFREVVSGESIAERTEFQKVLKLVESESIKVVIVKEITRLGRPDTMEIGLISKTFRYTDTTVIAIKPFKILNPADKYEREMFENELKQGNNYLEYVKTILTDGLDRSAMSGNYLGSRPPFGYDKTTIIENKKRCPTLAINEEQANIVRMIFDWYVNENIGTQTVSNRLNDLKIKSPRGQHWTPDSIRTVLENIHYIGLVRRNTRKTKLIVDNGKFRKTRPKVAEGEAIIVKGRHEAIISEELFHAAQEKRGRTHRTCDNKELKNPLASILFCECGKAMSYRKSTKGAYKYKPAVLACNGQKYCGNGSIRAEEMMDFIADALKQKIAEFEIEVKNVDRESTNLHEKMIKSLEKKLSDLNAREISLWESQVDPDITKRMPTHVFQALTEKLVAEREETETALAKARATVTTHIDYEKKIITFQKALDTLLDDEVSIAEKNHLLKQCIRRIDYHRDAPQKMTGKGAGRQWTQPRVDLDIKWMV